METTIRKVGNSMVITLPHQLCAAKNLESGDRISIEEKGDMIVLSPIKKKLKGEAFLEEYYGKPIEEIYISGWDTEVVDFGPPVGVEEW